MLFCCEICDFCNSYFFQNVSSRAKKCIFYAYIAVNSFVLYEKCFSPGTYAGQVFILAQRNCLYLRSPSLNTCAARVYILAQRKSGSLFFFCDFFRWKRLKRHCLKIIVLTLNVFSYEFSVLKT